VTFVCLSWVDLWVNPTRSGWGGGGVNPYPGGGGGGVNLSRSSKDAVNPEGVGSGEHEAFRTFRRSIPEVNLRKLLGSVNP